MTKQFGFISKRFGASAVILSSALLLSACSTFFAPFSGSKASESAQAASDTAASGDKDEMRIQCMAMQEKMKTNMAEGGAMMGDGMMSDEMKAKHKKCMETMPELREEMHKKCMSTQTNGAGHGKMMEGDMKKMHEHCMQMMHGDHENGAEHEAIPEEGKHQHKK